MLNVIIRNKWLSQLFLNKSDVFQLLFLHNLFCVGLVACRVFYTGEWMFTFLLWNLFLAYVPYLVSSFISERQSTLSNIKTVLFLLAWLLLIPNSFYIITDLFHLRQYAGIPLWYDLALIISFAWNGLIIGVLSVRQVEAIVKYKWQFTNEWLFVLPIMYLNALGIFIGRYLRFNSWDIITNPFDLINEVGYLLIHPFRNRFDWCMIICFTVLLSLFYLTLKKVSKHIVK